MPEYLPPDIYEASMACVSLVNVAVPEFRYRGVFVVDLHEFNSYSVYFVSRDRRDLMMDERVTMSLVPLLESRGLLGRIHLEVVSPEALMNWTLKRDAFPLIRP